MSHFSVLFVLEPFIATESTVFLQVWIPDLIDYVFAGQIKIKGDVRFDVGEKVKDTLLERPAFGPVVGFDLEFFDNVFDIIFCEERYLSDVIVMLSDTVLTSSSLLTLTMLKHTKLDNGLSMFALVHLAKE